MKKELFEELYCLSFSQIKEPARIVASLTNTFRKALNLRQVMVCCRNSEGYEIISSSPLINSDLEKIQQLKNCIQFELKDRNGINKGILYLVLKKRSEMTPKSRKICSAFATQISGLLALPEADYCGEQNYKKEIDHYKNLLIHDKLTGLYNRYYFEEQIKLLEGSDNYPVSMIMIDVDGLKIINDTMGHRFGDKALIIAAKLLKYTFRKEDIVTRIGGDEFVVMLARTPQKVAEQRCKKLSDAMFKYNNFNKIPPISLSTGCATSNGPEQPLADTLETADINMYSQKLKNRSTIKSSLLTNCRSFSILPSENTIGV
ncbi:MAG: putative diguanylate cyclase AdrA [Pelotomaculum sp. PtaB.Bin013]|uniref:Diguanylate cyclase n=1 Tax=Pelotomaculum isophthalicicum JI TaxID=947010 RepID=A0A9X4QB44_9FIRM|nr:diguanylate cyclase [Pelotomaculum isophthalicicum]MDF9410072.1 diguanylate cyclase [Pelotomaculum isophthalicicum JI]OPX92272.1 MAG: putative diguanylate cyclase AdrA [Pelotomaculum sp. PtaB.Bin013]